MTAMMIRTTMHTARHTPPNAQYHHGVLVVVSVDEDGDGDGDTEDGFRGELKLHADLILSKFVSLALATSTLIGWLQHMTV